MRAMSVNDERSGFLLSRCILSLLSVLVYRRSLAANPENDVCLSGNCPSTSNLHFIEGHCFDWNDSCSKWASEAACLTNPGYMLYYCGTSCDTCDYLTQAENAFERGKNKGGCYDDYFDCKEWALGGQCENDNDTVKSCRYSCKACEDDEVMKSFKNNNFTLPKIGDDIREYLNPKLFENHTFLESIKKKIQRGQAVVIRNAFKLEYAEAMHRELNALEAAFRLHEYFSEEDRFSYHHHNIYTLTNYGPVMDATYHLFNSNATKKFATEVTGRRCGGETDPSASWYKVGDHSLPHTDYAEQRTVAYVWHLSKNWKPGWGGHLYWMNEHPWNAFLDASFNTLVLFSVNALSHHMVTAVNPLAGNEKRLTINGWWKDDWMPSFEVGTHEFAAGYSDWIDYFTEDDARILELTGDQTLAVDDLVGDCKNAKDSLAERCDKLARLQAKINVLSRPAKYREVDILEL
ncbi:hypothetical protein HJC23_005007 [Cyclotella cryptica]|uniref:ShKT domain-containing protein n=1 Tax=Cyclotella cryptica TaxID=29204 RepID=A0ABD3QD87_9STRA|eukprot:CCRYP_006215-RC/>CCRYP_006215-RC protein AED:0.36 eAED:0.36 QI:124/0.5/0.66/1/1/1/3/83/461